MKIQIWNTNFNFKLEDSELSKKIYRHFPLEFVLDWRYWDELYFLTNFGLELDENAKEIFEIGDIVYWKKSDNSKEAIAIFFGNTPAWDWTKPRPVSKCSLIWKIIWEVTINDNIWKGDKIKLTKN